MIAVVVAAASAHENTVGIALLDKVAADTDTVQKALVDQGFKNAVVAHGQKVGIELEVVERNPAQTGFVPQAKRWVVERAYGILTLHRRLVRDYEHRPRSSESRVYWARGCGPPIATDGSATTSSSISRVWSLYPTRSLSRRRPRFRVPRSPPGRRSRESGRAIRCSSRGQGVCPSSRCSSPGWPAHVCWPRRPTQARPSVSGPSAPATSSITKKRRSGGARVRELTDVGATQVLEIGGAGTLTQSIEAVAHGGQIALVGNLAPGEGMDVHHFFRRAATLRSISVGSRSALERMTEAIARSGLWPVIDRVFPFEQAPEAVTHFKSGTYVGKAVISH
ncbi:Transposase DDE domain-containing protein [Streptomyces sp. DfronAA-171]|nr:Transposase DDE domain-containing protein [Streptomyces sp. DfronAA-171]